MKPAKMTNQTKEEGKTINGPIVGNKMHRKTAKWSNGWQRK